jgi:hypothetical protein
MDGKNGVKNACFLEQIIAKTRIQQAQTAIFIIAFCDANQRLLIAKTPCHGSPAPRV